jgi:archaellum component FlaC
MTRVHSAVARKDYPEHGITKGQKYYYWSFFRQGRRMSATPPRPSQLCNNKYSGALAAMEGLEDAVREATCPEDVATALDDAISALGEVKDEYESALSSLQDAFQGGSPQIDEHEEKIGYLDSCIESLEAAKTEVENMEVSDFTVNEYKTEPKEFDDLLDDDKEEMLSAARAFAEEVSLDS